MARVRISERLAGRPAHLIVMLLAASAVASSCAPKQETATRETPAPAQQTPPPAESPAAGTSLAGVGHKATATIEARSGSTLTGTATFTEEADGVRVVVEVAGAPPGDHAVHVHEKGDCSAPDASSAGSHFNPNHVDHGGPHTAVRHPGDFGNLTVGADGKGRLELVTKDLTVGESPISVVGLSIIVHEKADEFTQPVGNAGGRIGCGLITAAH
jgi:Cu-Zn family superoxide dismutase